MLGMVETTQDLYRGIVTTDVQRGMPKNVTTKRVWWRYRIGREKAVAR
jgi:hypothetical protein